MTSIDTIHWHTLSPDFLSPASTVLDLGANWGMFSSAIARRFDCSCIAVEPSPEPFNGIPVDKNISKLQLAVGGRSGTMNFRVDRLNSLASSLVHGDGDFSAEVVTLEELLGRIGWSRVDLLKVDIEGAEIDMLAACPDHTISKIAQITIEFHDFCGLTPTHVVRESISRLERLGFRSVRMSRVGHQDTWLVNTNLLPVSAVDILRHRAITRNWFGFKRILSRALKRD